MKRRCVFSVVIVITLVALSAMAFASSLAGIRTDEISEQRSLPGTAAAIKPEAKTELRQAVAESDPTDKPIKIQYQSVSACMDLDAEESYLLAKLAMAEAEGEDTEGRDVMASGDLFRAFTVRFSF